MTNDTTTLNGALAELGETMSENLVTMGVTGADPSDGLTTLAGKILQVPGGGGSGIDLDTAVSLTASSASIVTGGNVTLSSFLTASYDSTVDLEGVLIGATVKFKEGSTVLGTDTTDGFGEATATISGLSVGSHTLKAVFEGNSDFDACESSTVTVVVTSPEPDHITLTSNKSILSYADSESASLTATVYDASDNPLAGETVTMKVYKTSDDSLLETLTVTDENDGTYTASYLGKGTGDIYIKAECNLLVKTYGIEDCTYYNPNTVTSTTTVNISLPSNVEVSFKVKRTSSSNNYSYLEIGGNTGNTALMGQVGGAGVSQFRTYVSEGSSTIDTTHDTANVPSNTETLLVWTKNGANQSYSTGDSTVTWTDNHSHSKIRKLTISNNRVQELKVKPL